MAHCESIYMALHLSELIFGEVVLLTKLSPQEFLTPCPCGIFLLLSISSGDSSRKLRHLDWKMRQNIALSVAVGLDYLHNGCNPSIIHRDVKSSNILLDNNWNAKVADFGLSKENSSGTTHVTTFVKGTAGYFDPEYFLTMHLGALSDVFSFGVVLLELICGRPPFIHSADYSERPWSV